MAGAGEKREEDRGVTIYVRKYAVLWYDMAEE